MTTLMGMRSGIECWEPPHHYRQYEILRGMTSERSGVTSDESVDGVDQIEESWNRERPDIDVSSVGIVTRLWRIARHFDRQRNEYLAGWETDRGIVDILGMLRRAGKPYRRSAGDLTKHALITSGGVSQRLEKLERAGLIVRQVDTTDRRRVDVELTAAGVELIDSVFGDVMDRDSAVIASVLDEHEQEALRRLLRKLLLALEPHDQYGV